MDVEAGRAYHIKDEFYTLVKDESLMKNKENGNYRPHVFMLPDSNVAGLYWAIPISSRVEKFKEIYNEKLEKYGRCDTIEIAQFAGEERAYLIQNMFPVIERYVDHEHTVDNIPVRIHDGLKDILETKMNRVLSLHKKGISLVYTDINRLYDLMVNESKETPNDQET